MRALITGAANGIGQSLTAQCIAGGYQVVGVDYDRAKLQLLRDQFGDRFEPHAVDLLDRDSIGEMLCQWEGGPPFDLVIHSAGINYVGRFMGSSLDDQKQVLDLNLRVPMQLTGALLRHDRIPAPGSIVFIASLSVYVSYPGATVYAASKEGLSSYARSLSVELAPRGIHALTVFPGPTRTDHAHRYSPDNSREARRMSPDALASMILTAVRKRQTVLVPGWKNRMAAFLGRAAGPLMEKVMQRVILDRLANEDGQSP